MTTSTPTRTRTELTAVEQVRLRHLVTDHGARYYGQAGPFTFTRGDAVRYTTEGYAAKAFPDINFQTLWSAVDAALTDEILAAGKLSDDQVAANVAARRAAAFTHDRAALRAYRADDFDTALAEVDAGELACPDWQDFWTWDQLREVVRKRAAEVADLAARRAAEAAARDAARVAYERRQAREDANWLPR